MKIEMVAPERIKLAGYNPRIDLKPGDDAYEKISASIRKHGLLQPLVVNSCGGEMVLVGGHQRLKVLVAEGFSEVPVVVVNLSPEDERALNLALNKIEGEWDERKLAEVIEELAQVPQFDLGSTGFDSPEIADLRASIVPRGPADQEEVFDLAAELGRIPEAVTKPGDRISLGRHALMCGDSADAEQLKHLLEGAPIHLVNTDPPYNVNVEPRSNNAIAASGKGRRHHQGLDLARHPGKRKPTGRLRAKDRVLANDFVSEDEFNRLLRAWFSNASQALVPGRGFYAWGGYANLGNYPAALKEAGLYFSQAIVWHKKHAVLTRKDFMGDFELAFYGWKLGASHYFAPDVRNATDVWTVQKIAPQSMLHLTEKPVELAVRAMTYSSRPGENVLDLFGGSGSTLIAAERVSRKAFLMEIDPLYCDVVVRRYLAFVGPEKHPELAEKYCVKGAARE